MNKQKITAYTFLILTAFVLSGCLGTTKAQAQMYLEAEAQDKSQGIADRPDGQDRDGLVSGSHPVGNDPASDEGVVSGDGTASGNDPASGDRKDGKSDPGTCFVYVCGAVKFPGVFELPQGSRIYEAIALAGGLQEDACARGINQAGLIQDGDMIEILTMEEYEESGQAAATVQTGALDGSVSDGSAQAGSGQAVDGLVNINTADAAQLMTLNGIGEAKAAAVIAYREENGRFTDIAQIKNVRGIGESVYDKIKDKIKVA